MSAYMKSVIATTIFVSVVFSLFGKDGIGKYCNMLAGLIILAVIVMPMKNLIANKNSFALDVQVEELTLHGNNYLLDALEETLAEKIEEKLKRETNKSFSVSVMGTCDDEGTLTGIEKIKIRPYTETYAELVASFVGIEKVKVEELT